MNAAHATRHALLSPSSAARWMRCPGSAALNAQLPRTSNLAADTGTAAHEIAARLLAGEIHLPDSLAIGDFVIPITAEMLQHVRHYVEYVQSFGGRVFPEARLALTAITGEPNAWGTSDAVILTADELVVVDLKMGSGVRVEAIGNEQLLLYALAAYDTFKTVVDVQNIRLAIVQPPLDHRGEVIIDVPFLEAFRENVASAAKKALACGEGGATLNDLLPGEIQCRWCAAKAHCPALRDSVLLAFAAPPVELLDAEELSRLMDLTPLIEHWCRAIRGRVASEILAGNAVPNYRLVAGRMGPRQWTDASQAAQRLQAFGLSDEALYARELLSAPNVEKLIKRSLLTKEQWASLQDLITRKPGPPHVARVDAALDDNALTVEG